MTLALNGSMPPSELARLVSQQIVETLGVSVGAIYLVEPDGRHAALLATHGWPCDAPAPVFDRFSVSDDSTPVCTSIRTRQPVWLNSLAEFQERYPVLAAGCDHELSIGCIPLEVNGRVLASLALTFFGGRELDASLREFIVYLASLCAQALERERLHEEVTRSRERLSVLARVGDLLSSSLDYEKTLFNVVRAAMPAVGDFGFFDLVEGQAVRRVAYAHEDPARQSILASTQWVKNERRDMNLCALSSGESGLHADIDDAWLAKVAVAPAHLELMQKLAFQSMLTVPLRSEGEVLGALTLFFVKGGRRHEDQDVQLAEDIASRAASALMNARLYREATRAEQEARAALRHRDDFLSIASHELRTPLSTLEMGLDLMRRCTEPEDQALSARHVQRLDISLRQVGRMKRLVDHLLDVSRISSGALNLSPERVDLGGLVQEAVSRLGEADASRIHLQLQPDLAQGEWDRSRIDQVVSNLLVNALKYGGTGPIEVELSSAGASVRLRVTDHGIGIAPEDQARIFSRFERAVSERNYGGFGLGLWISNEIVAAHGGSISLQSEPGKGSTFVVMLPSVGLLRRVG